MIASGKILIVDDNPDFLQTYRELLGDEGYEVETASDRDRAIQLLSRPDWDVVLLDQRLQGEAGPDTGIDLVGEVRRLSPGAKPIVVTAFASSKAIERAFSSGAYDYLEKNQQFSALLRAKVRNATEVVRERRLGALARAATEETLRSTWQAVVRETDPHRKGALLEDLLVLLFKTIPGLHHVEANRRNEQEEVDVLVRNESQDTFWTKESQYFLIECKHWTKPVGKDEFILFVEKMKRRYGRCELGFFVAMGGYAKTFQIEQLTERLNKMLVVPMTQVDLERLIGSEDRNAALKALHQRAVMATNGNGKSH